MPDVMKPTRQLVEQQLAAEAAGQNPVLVATTMPATNIPTTLDQEAIIRAAFGRFASQLLGSR